MVKKASKKWKMCVDYINLNRAFPKDSYTLSNIHKFIDNSFGYKLLSFMDADSGCNQTPMFSPDQMKTTFMIEQVYHQMKTFCLSD